jgi:curved DNA-binding protein CbpA
MLALDKAAKSLHDGPTSIDFTEYYQALGLDMSENPNASQINRAYRKAALKCHPDKKGDPAEV